MEHIRLVFSTFAGFFCICLGTFSLLNNPSSRVNRYFAFYNFSNALWNIGDVIVLFHNKTLADSVLKVSGIGGCFLFPFLMAFIYEYIGIADKKIPKQIIHSGYFMAVIFAFLHQFSLVNYAAFVDSGGRQILNEMPGNLYPLFATFLLFGLIFSTAPLPFLMNRNRGLKRRQIAYVFLACAIGIVGLIFFFIALYSFKFPLSYHPLQVIVTFVFSYAIFRHDLIPIPIALRRASLIIGIYVAIGVLLAPTIFFGPFSQFQNFPWAYFVGFLVLAGVSFSMGPLVYAFMVRRSTLFQEETTKHIAHEFKSPLAAIRNSYEILDSQLKDFYPSNPGLRDYLEMVERNTGRLEKFVGEILDLVKVSDKNEAFRKMEKVDLADMAQEVVMLFPRSRGRISLRVSGPAIITGIRQGLELILSNLISNAEKYSTVGPITISLNGTDRALTVIVEDEGKGIAPEELERIFEPFVRGKSAERDSKGSGLGLAIVLKWVQVHGGKIWAESKGPNQGSKFTVIFPS